MNARALLATLALALAVAATAVTPAQAQEVRLGGLLRLERRVAIADSVRFIDFHNLFRPSLSVDFGGRTVLESSFDVRFYDLSNVTYGDGLDDSEQHFPTNITLWEAYVRLSGVLHKSLDLTVGKQRTAWGTADGLNPTDRFDGRDISDPVDFTARVPTWGIRGEYYLTDRWWIDAAWTPTAHGPILPKGFDGLFGTGGLEGLAGSVTEVDQRFEPPGGRLSDGQFGARVRGVAWGLDVSASYFDGFDGLPVIRGIVLEDSGSSGGTAALVFSGLPRFRVLGGDLAGERFGIGFWAEGAVVFPERVEVSPVGVAGTTASIVTLDDRPYATWTAGADHTFSKGVYLNLQWAHGLFFERNSDELHDYLMMRLDRSFLRDKVTVALEGAAEFAQWTSPRESFGYAVFPKVDYRPGDGVTLSLGGILAGGRGESTLSLWSKADQLYLRASAVF